MGSAGHQTAESASRNDPFRHFEAVLGDVARARHPDAVLALVDAMLDRLAQRPQPERLTDDETVQREREHQRLALGLLEHLLELVDDHLGELAAGMVAM